MDRHDIRAPLPGTGRPLPVTRSGDLVLIRGVASVNQWALRTVLATAGSVLLDPVWGVGIDRLLGTSGSGARGAMAARIRSQLERNRRIVRARVTVQPSTETPGRVNVGYALTLVDGTETTGVITP